VRVSDHRRPPQERLLLEVQAGAQRQQAVLPLPPGRELVARIAEALAAAAVRTAPPGGSLPSLDCELGSGSACLALASQGGGEAMLQRACTLGEGAACRQLAARSPQAGRLLRAGCLLQDAESCGEFARLSPSAVLTLADQTEQAGAYHLACSAGLLWACNDLAVLIGRIVEYDTEHACRNRSRGVMTQILKEACTAGDALACENHTHFPPDNGRLDTLKQERPRP
jgi:hypothetical protein